jgi:hypothetical protein
MYFDSADMNVIILSMVHNATQLDQLRLETHVYFTSSVDIVLIVVKDHTSRLGLESPYSIRSDAEMLSFTCFNFLCYRIL